ncbi:MAG: aldehyde ferredoxin oxidoreductase N-terminal domain-containing protein [Promethearchaeota archaeon]
MLKEFTYEVPKIEKGYANQTLYVNLSDNTIKIKPVDEKMKETFTGGKGFDLWLMWNGLPKDRIVKWDDPENEICIATGPLGGAAQYPGAGKSVVTSISPMTGIVIDSNVGGYVGPNLKFSGFDAAEIQGKAEKDVYILIDGDHGKVEIHDASDLPDTAYEITRVLGDRHTELEGKDMAVATAGPGSESELLLVGYASESSSIQASWSWRNWHRLQKQESQSYRCEVCQDYFES